MDREAYPSSRLGADGEKHLSKMQAEQRVNLVFLDACRDNPFRAHEPRPLQMLWAPPAVAPNDVLRVASASTTPTAWPAPPQQLWHNYLSSGCERRRCFGFVCWGGKVGVKATQREAAAAIMRGSP